MRKHAPGRAAESPHVCCLVQDGIGDCLRRGGDGRVDSKLPLQLCQLQRWSLDRLEFGVLTPAAGLAGHALGALAKQLLALSWHTRSAPDAKNTTGVYARKRQISLALRVQVPTTSRKYLPKAIIMRSPAIYHIFG